MSPTLRPRICCGATRCWLCAGCRLATTRSNDVTVNQYVAADGKQAVVFALRHSQQYNTAAPTIRLRGLDEHALYKVESLDNKLVERQPQLSGAYLMRSEEHT